MQMSRRKQWLAAVRFRPTAPARAVRRKTGTFGSLSNVWVAMARSVGESWPLMWTWRMPARSRSRLTFSSVFYIVICVVMISRHSRARSSLPTLAIYNQVGQALEDDTKGQVGNALTRTSNWEKTTALELSSRSSIARISWSRRRVLVLCSSKTVW